LLASLTDSGAAARDIALSATIAKQVSGM